MTVLLRILIGLVAAAVTYLIANAELDAELDSRKASDGAVAARSVKANATGSAEIRSGGETVGVVRLAQVDTRITGQIVLWDLPPNGSPVVEIHAPERGCARLRSPPAARIPVRTDSRGAVVARVDEREGRTVVEPQAVVRVSGGGTPPRCGRVPVSSSVSVSSADGRRGGLVNLEQEGELLRGDYDFVRLPKKRVAKLDRLPPGSDGCRDPDAKATPVTVLRPDGGGTAVGRFAKTIPRIVPGTALRIVSAGRVVACGPVPTPLLTPIPAPGQTTSLDLPIHDLATDTPRGMLNLIARPNRQNTAYVGFLLTWGHRPGERIHAEIGGPGGSCRTRVSKPALDLGTTSVRGDGIALVRLRDRTAAEDLIIKGYYVTIERASSRSNSPLACADLLPLDTENIRDYSVETENGRPTGDPVEISVQQLDTVRLVVRADERRADTVRVPEYGITLPVSRSAPAELLFPATLTGTFEIVMGSTGEPVATLQVSE